MRNSVVLSPWLPVVGAVGSLALAAVASAAPVVGNLPADPALEPALGLSIGQVVSEGGAYVGEIDPSIYQPYADGTGDLPVLVLAFSVTNTAGTNNALFAQPGSDISFNGGTNTTGSANIGGTGSQTPTTNTFVGGFNLFDFYSAGTNVYQNGTNDGLVIFQVYPSFTPGTLLTDATLTLNTFYTNSPFAVGYPLDVFEINPALGISASDASYQTLTSVVPEPASLAIASAAGIFLLRRRRSLV